MKPFSTQSGQVVLFVIMMFIAVFTAFEILITWDAGMWKDYPLFMIGIFLGFPISTLCLVRIWRSNAL